MYCFNDCPKYNDYCESCIEIFNIRHDLPNIVQHVSNSGSIIDKKILLNEEQKKEYLWAFEEYNYLKAYGNFRSEKMRKRIEKDVSSKGYRCIASFLGEELETLFCSP